MSKGINDNLTANDLLLDDFTINDSSIIDVEIDDIQGSIPFKTEKDIESFNGQIIRTIQEIKELVDICSIYTGLRRFDVLFRGLSNTTNQLLPSIAYNDPHPSEEIEREVIREYIFSNKHNEFIPPKTDKTLFYMGNGRHIGLASRLMDWTTGIWVALSFVAMSDYDKDGALWIMYFKRGTVKYDNTLSPLSICDDKVHLYKVDYRVPTKSLNAMPIGEQRRFNQNGYFSACSYVHSFEPLDEVVKKSSQDICIIKVVVSSQLKNNILETYRDNVRDYLLPTVDKEQEELINKLNERMRN